MKLRSLVHFVKRNHRFILYGITFSIYIYLSITNFENQTLRIVWGGMFGWVIGSIVGMEAELHGLRNKWLQEVMKARRAVDALHGTMVDDLINMVQRAAYNHSGKELIAFLEDIRFQAKKTLERKDDDTLQKRS